MRIRTFIVIVCSMWLGHLAHAQLHDITGAWRYNPELSTPIPPAPPEGMRPRGGGVGRPPGGGRGMPGMPGMGQGGPSEDDMRRLRVIRRRLNEPPASLVIVRDGAKMVVTYGDGRTVSYLTDGRKEDRLTGDGEFTSRARFEGKTLVVEEDFGGGVKLTTRVSPIMSENRERLEVVVKAAGLPKPGGGRRSPDAEDGRGPRDGATRVYERVERLGDH